MMRIVYHRLKSVFFSKGQHRSWPYILARELYRKFPFFKDTKIRLRNLIKPKIQDQAIKHYLEYLRHQETLSDNDTLIPSFKTLPLLASDLKISTIISTRWKNTQLTLPMIDFLLRKNIEVIVVSNSEQFPESLDPRVIILHEPIPFNFPKMNNVGANASSGDLLIFLHDDLEIIQEDWLDHLIEIFEDPSVGMAGPVVFNSDGSVQSAGTYFRMENNKVIRSLIVPEKDRLCSSLDGSCIVLRKNVFSEIHGFDEEFISPYSEMITGFLIGRYDYKVVLASHSRIKHYDTENYSTAHTPEDTLRFWRKYGKDILIGLSESPQSDSVRMVNSPFIDINTIKTGIIFKMDHLGDIAIAMPAIRELVRKFPKTEWTIVCGTWGKILFENEGFKNIVTINMFGENGVMGGWVGLSDHDKKILNKMSCDLAIDFRVASDTRFLLGEVSAHITVGYPSPQFHPSREFPVINDLRHIHNGRQLLWMVSDLLTYESTKKDVRRIGLVPATSSPTKRWATPYWIELGKLLSQAGFSCVLAGGPLDMPYMEMISKETGIRILPIGPIGTFASRMSNEMDMAIVLDSGPGHILAQTGMFIVEVMGSSVPVPQWASYGPNVLTVTSKVDCSPCYQASYCPFQMKCLQIPVEDVLRGVGKILKRAC